MTTISLSNLQQCDILSSIFMGLKDQSEETRLRSAIELHSYMSTEVAAMSLDAAANVWDGDSGINRRLFDLVRSPSNIENLGGILAINAYQYLLDVDGEETIQSKRNLFRFYNLVKALLPNNDHNVMLAASKTLGKIVKMGGAAFAERFTDYEVHAAIDLLQSDLITRRYAGVLVLNELARNGPMIYFHPHLDLVYDNILAPLQDACAILAEGAAELLAACLEIEGGQQTPNSHLYKALWKDIHTSQR